MVENMGLHFVEAANATDTIQDLETRPDIRIVKTLIDVPDGIDGVMRDMGADSAS